MSSSSSSSYSSVLEGPPSSMPVVVLDNGASNCRIGLSTGLEGGGPTVINNCAIRPKREKKMFVADQTSQIIDFSNVKYRRPFERGYITNWELELQIWRRLFGPPVMNVNPAEHALLVTEPLFTPSSIQRTMDEIVFEEFGFSAYCRMPGPSLAPLGYAAQHGVLSPPYKPGVSLNSSCCVVVDVGYSFAHVVPMLNGRPVQEAVRRINAGGKLLTNYLKEVISYRAWNMMDETHLINHVKERLCFVSLDFDNDLRACQSRDNGMEREYVLPDGNSFSVGYVKGEDEPPSRNLRMHDDGSDEEDEVEEENCLEMNNERISIPEILFSPSNIGIDQAGIGEVIVQAVSAAPESLQGMLYENILLVGGCVNFPHFKERVYKDVRSFVDEVYDVFVYQPEDVDSCIWQGGCAFANQESFISEECITRQQYHEHGFRLCEERFFPYRDPPPPPPAPLFSVEPAAGGGVAAALAATAAPGARVDPAAGGVATDAAPAATAVQDAPPQPPATTTDGEGDVVMQMQQG